MAFDPNGLIEAISSAISKFPPALFAAALLGGSTAIWFIVRFANPRDPGKPEPVVAQDLLWVCEACRSINADRLDRCYSCHRLRAADLIPVVSDSWGDDSAYEWGEEVPEVLIDALHHAREHLSVEQDLAILRWLTDGYGDYVRHYLRAMAKHLPGATG